jgi:Coenzyme PQQ synthesis protein D (PqqD)
MSEVSNTSVPKREFFVRRRKYEGQCWLIARTSFYEIDGIVELVWLACNGDVPIAEIAKSLGEQKGMPSQEAEAAARNAVKLLVDLGLVKLK